MLKKSLFWGMLGALTLMFMTGIRIVAGIQEILQVDGAANVLLQLVWPALLIGFVCGFLSSVLARLLGRYGVIGLALIGAIMVPLYLFSFLWAFGPEAMEEYGNAAFLGMGAVIGMIAVPLGFRGFGEIDEPV